MGKDNGVHIKLGVLLQRLDPARNVEVGVEEEHNLIWCCNISNVANLVDIDNIGNKEENFPSCH